MYVGPGVPLAIAAAAAAVAVLLLFLLLLQLLLRVLLYHTRYIPNTWYKGFSCEEIPRQKRTNRCVVEIEFSSPTNTAAVAAGEFCTCVALPTKHEKKSRQQSTWKHVCRRFFLEDISSFCSSSTVPCEQKFGRPGMSSLVHSPKVYQSDSTFHVLFHTGPCR